MTRAGDFALLPVRAAWDATHELKGRDVMAKTLWEVEASSGETPFEMPAFEVPIEASRRLHEEARNYSPAGVQGDGGYYAPFPLYMKKAMGARLWDVDDNEYIAYSDSHRPPPLRYNGHAGRRA